MRIDTGKYMAEVARRVVVDALAVYICNSCDMVQYDMKWNKSVLAQLQQHVQYRVCSTEHDVTAQA